MVTDVTHLNLLFSGGNSIFLLGFIGTKYVLHASYMPGTVLNFYNLHNNQRSRHYFHPTLQTKQLSHGEIK